MQKVTAVDITHMQKLLDGHKGSYIQKEPA